MKFKIGDRVEAIDLVDGENLKGKIGTIVHITDTNPHIGVEFDTYIGGHDCAGHGRYGYCRYGHENEFEHDYFTSDTSDLTVGADDIDCLDNFLSEFKYK